MRLQPDMAGLFARVVAFAEARHGVVDFGQLGKLGARQAWVARQVRAQTLHPMHRGVYSVVPLSLLRPEGWWLAAVLGSGPGAALSHRDAVALWDLWTAGPAGSPVHVTVPTHAGRAQRPGIRIHRSVTLNPEDVTVRRGISVTTLRRTIADMRRVLPAHSHRSLIRRAQMRHLDVGPVSGELSAPVDRSELERRFFALVRRHSLPAPLPQQIIGAYTVDFLWPDRSLIVEVDGWETHGTRTAFEDDRARDAWLMARGYRVVRFTWRQVTREGPWVARTLRAVLMEVKRPRALPRQQ